MSANQGTIIYCVLSNIVWIDGDSMKPTTMWTTVLNVDVMPIAYYPSYGLSTQGHFGDYGVNHMTVIMDVYGCIKISAASAATSANGAFTIIYPIQ